MNVVVIILSCYLLYQLYKLIRSYVRFKYNTTLFLYTYQIVNILEPDPVELAVKRGMLLMMAQDYVSAKSHFYQAISLYRDSGRTYLLCLNRDVISTLELNIVFCDDYRANKSYSYVTYLYVRYFGKLRVVAYKGMDNDLRESHETLSL